MSWNDIAAKVASLGAPILGGALGGPVGAAAGRLAARVVASALEVEAFPDDLGMALATDPDAALKLRALELTHKAEILRLEVAQAELTIAAERADLAQVNETMRAELMGGNWYQKGWRPTFGYITAICYGAILLAVAKVVWMGGDPALITALASITVLLSVGLSVLGVTAFRRSTDKQTLAGITPAPGILDAVTTSLRGGKG